MRLCRTCQRKIPEDSHGVCDECKAAKQHSIVSRAGDIQSHTSGYDAVLDGLRKGTRWQNVRRIVLGRDPLCKRCEMALAEICDHVVPAAIAVMQAQESKRYPLDKYAGYFLLSNLQGLCRACHGIKTLEDKAHTGPWPSVLDAEDKAPKKKWTF